MTLRNHMRSVAPFAVWQTIGFVRRIPAYWRLDRSDALRVRGGAGGLALYVTKDVSVLPPEDLTAYICWRTHGIGEDELAHEARDFMELSENCFYLFDIGAQTGFMSALFARFRKDVGAHVLSVEPDPQVLPALRRAAELNRGEKIEWVVVDEAVAAKTGQIQVRVSNKSFDDRANAFLPPEITANSVTISDLVSRCGWVPDILKIDVESFEYEILCSELAFFGEHKPALQLEVHWQMLRERGRDAYDFLGPLSEMGYRGIRRNYRNLKSWKRAEKSESVSRIALIAA